MTDVELDKESANIAKAYKKLLKVSYQTLTDDDKKLIRSDFGVAVDAQKRPTQMGRDLYSSLHPRRYYSANNQITFHVKLSKDSI